VVVSDISTYGKYFQPLTVLLDYFGVRNKYLKVFFI